MTILECEFTLDTSALYALTEKLRALSNGLTALSNELNHLIGRPEGYRALFDIGEPRAPSAKTVGRLAMVLRPTEEAEQVFSALGAAERSLLDARNLVLIARLRAPADAEAEAEERVQ